MSCLPGGDSRTSVTTLLLVAAAVGTPVLEHQFLLVFIIFIIFVFACLFVCGCVWVCLFIFVCGYGWVCLFICVWLCVGLLVYLCLCVLYVCVYSFCQMGSMGTSNEARVPIVVIEHGESIIYRFSLLPG